MYHYKRQLICLLVATVFSPGIIFGGEADFKKTGELYYQIFRNNNRTGYAHTEFYEMTENDINWVRVVKEKKEEVSGWFSSKVSRSHSTILLKNNLFNAMKSTVEKDGRSYEVDIKAEKDGVRIVVTNEKEARERVIPYSDYDYTSIDSPYRYLKLYDTPYTLNILDLDELDVLRSKVTLMRKEKMEDRQMPFESWVIRVENKKSRETDWITPDGIFIQSVGSDQDGSFLIKASSREKALAGY